MGAELILAFVDVSEPKQKWLDILGEWDDGSVDRFVTDCGYDYMIDDITEEIEDDLNMREVDDSHPSWADHRIMAKARQKFTERIQDAIDTAYGAAGRISHKVILDGKPWAITGGLSWGDEPSDDFEHFSLAETFIEYQKNLANGG